MVLSLRFAALSLLGLIPVVLWPSWSTIGLCLLALLLLAGLDWFTAASPRSVAFSREIAYSVRLDETSTAEIIVENLGRRRLIGSLRDGWQPTAGAADAQQQIKVPGGQRRRVTTTLTPRRRGTLGTEVITVRSWGRLGLIARQVSHPCPGQITVLPPFRSRKQLPSRLAQLREMDGRSPVQIRGAGHEFDSLRDYVRGDDVRSIDWRATARRQDLVVRTWRPERDRRVVIVLDASRTAAARVGDETRFDTAIESALLLAALAQAGGDRVEVLAFDRAVRARASSLQKGPMLHHLVTSLADVEPRLLAADWTQVPVEVSKVSRQRSLVVLVTSLDAGSMQEGLFPVLPHLSRQHQVLVASTTDPELTALSQQRDDAGAVFMAAAAERSSLEDTNLVQMLNSYGAEVVQAAPHDLPAAVADTYLRLKAAGRL